MLQLTKTAISVVTISAMVSALAACEKKEVASGEQGPAERVGQQLDQAAARASEELNKVAEKAGKGLQEAGQKLQNQAQEAQKKDE